MSTPDTLRRLDDLIASRSILRHPFYIAWQRGTLTREQLATYARVYYPHVAAFPRYLTATAATATDPQVRAALDENLHDELHEPKAHHELWLDFAAAVGADRDDVAAAVPQAEAGQVVERFAGLAASGTAQGLAALYAYESQQPDVAAEKASGLKEHYGVTDPQALGYFAVHAATDVAHRAAEREALARCLDAGTPEQAILDAAGQALDGYWQLLDAVCEEAGIRCE